MARAQEIVLRAEPWADELAPILARLYGEDRAAYRDGLIAAVQREDAVALVARRDGAALGLAIVAFQRWPVREMVILAMATVPRSGVDFGRAFVAAIRAQAAAARATCLRAEARTDQNLRRLARLGFRAVSRVMVLPC